MKTNITLKVDTTLLREARVLAAEKGISVSDLMSECLEQVFGVRNDYARARKRAMARLRKGLNLNWTPPCSRNELHER